MRKFGQFFMFYALIPFLASVPFLFLNVFLPEPWIDMIGVPALAVLLYLLFRKKLDFKAGARIYGLALVILTAVFTVLMVLAKGNIEGTLMLNFCFVIFPYVPVMLLPILMGVPMVVFATAFLTCLAGWLFCTLKTRSFAIRKIVIPAIAILVCAGISTYLYADRPAVKYGGHGFEYMHGYSSTDFKDYTVYAKNSKLATLDHEPSLVIEDPSEMPILDGAEACYPLYAAFAKAVYKDIDQIEKDALNTDDQYHNGRIVSFTNTIYGFNRLVLNREDPEKYGANIDMFFGARPSGSQLELAKEMGVEIEVIPIGKEAFVFFVEKDNPVEDVSADELRAIYHGDIENWEAVGGKKQQIVAFQRPNNSGSQTMMKYFMGDVELKTPETYEMVDAMGGVVSYVAEYANEAGAIGYTFRYFLEELNQERGVKMLSVDGVYPTVESIEDGSYPLTVDLCLIVRKDDPNPSVAKMIEFILSEDGQELIRKTGYGALGAE